MHAHMLSLLMSATPSSVTACAPHTWQRELDDVSTFEAMIAAPLKRLRERSAVKQVLRYLHP